VIFFVAVGFPTLINTSPTIGYDDNTIAKLTPVTTFYQEAYAEQQAMNILSKYYYEPIMASAFLVMPIAIDNLPPPDPVQYFLLKYSQGIEPEFGFIEFGQVQEFFEPIVNELLNFEFLPEAFAEVFPFTATSHSRMSRSLGITGTACSLTGISNTADDDIRVEDADPSASCNDLGLEWDISSIPDGSTITDIQFRFDTSSPTVSRACEIKPMQFQPSTASSQTLIDDIENGTAFIASTATCQFTLTDNQLDLGISADSDLEANLVDDWWAIGMSYVDETRDSASLHDVIITNARIQVTYIPPAPVATTGLTVTQDLAPYAILDWDDIPTATSYNIYWDHNLHTSDFILIANVPNSNYVDKRVPYHKQNCLSNALLCDKYKVSAVNGGGEGSNSTTVDFGLYIPTRTSEVFNFRTVLLDGFVQYFQARWIFDSNWNSSPNFIGTSTSLDVYYRLGSNETNIHITNDTISNVGTFTTNGNDIFGQKVTVPAMNLTRIIQKFDFNSAFPTAGNITAFVWNSTNGFIDVSNDTVHFPLSADLKDVTTCEVTGCDSVRDHTFFFPTQVPLSAGEYVFGLRHEGVTSTGTHGQGVISSDVDSGVRVSESDWTNGITFVEDVGSDSNIQIIGIADGWVFCQNTGSDDDDVNCPRTVTHADFPLANGTEVWIQAFVDVAGQRSAIVPISSLSTRELGFTPAGSGINASAIVGGSSSLPDTGADGGFIAEFKINFTSFPTSPRTLVLALSDKNQDIDADTNDNDILAVMARNNGVNDGLRILFVDNGDATSGGCGVELCLSSGIDLLTNTTYYPRLERVNGTFAELSVFTNSGRTIHVAGSPVSSIINATIDGLQYVHSQHMSSNAQSTIGNLDDLIIGNTTNFFADAFSTNSSWVQTGTGVTIANGQVEGWTAFAGDQRITHDLGFILDEGDISIPPTAPAPITTLNATQINSILLQWVAPDDGGSPITGYEIQRTRSDIARNGTYMDFLFREHEISGEIDSIDTTDEVILSASEGFVGQAFNVTSDEEVGAIAVSLHRITTTACSGSAFLQGTIFFDNATRVKNSTNTFTVCSVAPNTPPVITEDHIFIFNNTEIFNATEYVFGVEKIGTNTDGDIDIPLSTVRTTLAEGFSVRDFSSPPFVFTNDTSTDTAVTVFILNFTTLVADTGNTNTNFTDTTCPAGITCYYRAQGINAIGTAGKSNIANATETGLETIFNATSNVNNIWSYRSHDDEYGAGTGIGGQCSSFAGLFNCGGVPDTDFETAQVSGFDHRPKMSATFGATSNTPQAEGNGYIFKTFTRNAILNQDIKVFWELVEAGGNDRPMQIQVYDGAYIAENNEDFPYNNAIKLKGGGLLGFCSTQIGGTDKPVHFTECLDGIDGNDRFGVIDIDYSLSTEDYITVFIQQQPITLSIADLYLNNMTITNVAFWDFINAGVTNTRGLFNDTRDLQFSQKAGFYTGNATIISTTPPAQITDLQATIGNTTEIWDATGAISSSFFGNDPDFPKIWVQSIPTQTTPVLIDSMRMEYITNGGTGADPEGILKGVIVGDRTGDLDFDSTLANMYFIENSTNTIQVSTLANPAIVTFNFSGNTILDSGDFQVGIGMFSDTDNQDTGSMDTVVNAGQTGQLAGGNALMMNQQNAGACTGQIDSFERLLCVNTNTDVYRDLEIFGGNGRAILSWTAPADNGDAISGYKINVANATELMLYKEMNFPESNIANATIGDNTNGEIVLGTGGDPNGHIAGQRITFPYDVVVTTLVISMGTEDQVGGVYTGGDVQAVILKDSPNGTSSFTRVVNSSSVNTRIVALDDAFFFANPPNCCGLGFSFEPTTLSKDVEYIIGVEPVDVSAPVTVFADFPDNDGFPNAGSNGVFTQLNPNVASTWFDNSTLNLNAQIFGYNLTVLVADTGTTSIEFTDTVSNYPSSDGKINQRVYSVEAINGGGNANASNFVELSPDRDLPNGDAQFDTWSLREQDTRHLFNTDCSFGITTELGALGDPTSSSLEMIFDGANAGAGAEPFVNTCSIFKSFDRLQMTGSDINIKWNSTHAGAPTKPFIRILDGGYDNDNSGDFIKGENPYLTPKGDRNSNPTQGHLNVTGVIYPLITTPIFGGCTGDQCDVTIPASVINYSSAIENKLTIQFEGFFGAGAIKKFQIGEISVSNIGTWDFRNNPRIIDSIANGRAPHPTPVNSNQTVSVNNLAWEDDRGITVVNSFFNGTVVVIPPPPPPSPITDLEVRLENTTVIYDFPVPNTEDDIGKFPSILVEIFDQSFLDSQSGSGDNILIDSFSLDLRQENADLTGLPVGTMQGVIIGDRTGDLGFGSFVNNTFFIENSTNTISTASLSGGFQTFIFNFSGNTIIDADDGKFGVGVVITSHTNEISYNIKTVVAVGSDTLVVTGGTCDTTNQVFRGHSCGVADFDLAEFIVYGGKARAIINWTEPVGIPTGYEIARANATQQIIYDEEVELPSFCLTTPSDGRCENIGTLADPLGIVGQRITFPTDVQLTNVMLNLGYNDGFPFQDGDIDIQGVILKDAPVGTGSFTRVANSTYVKVGETILGDVTGGNPYTFNDFNNCCPEAFTFNNTILTAGVEYIIGVESFGTFSGTDIFLISHNATANVNAPNNGLGVFTKLHVGTSDLWVDNSTENLNAMFMGLNYTVEVADTGNTNVEYTSTADFPSADGNINAYRYLVKGINAGGSANASNTAEVSPDRTGFDVWDYMEHDTREFFTSTCTFETNEQGVFAMNFTGIGVGFCYLFKSFNKTEITGSDIGINANFTNFGRIFFQVLDGSYDKDDFADFPVNSPHPRPIIASAIKGIGILNQTDTLNVGLDQCDLASPQVGLRQCDVVIPASGINYAGSTEDEITLFIKLFDGSTAIGNIEISNVGSWDFKNNPRQVIGINNGVSETFSTGASNNQDDRGNVYSNGIFIGNVTVVVPDQVTGLNITQNMNNNATLDWNDATGADNYQVLRKVNVTDAEVNTNSTWSFRAFRSGSVGIDAQCQVLDSGSGATGGILLKNPDSGNDADCNFWKFFPRDFLNNTRIQYSYTLTHIFGSQFSTTTIVGTENDPQSNRFVDQPEPFGYGTTVPAWTSGISNDGINLRGNIDTNAVAITSVQTTEEFVDLQSQWDVADSDYISLVFRTNDLSLATSQPTLKIFWINITDFDTLEQKAFYNFSGNTRVTERSGSCDSGDPSSCGFGRFDAGTTVITTETFEEIGTPITSDFEDSTLPITGVSTYKVRGNNTSGFGLNSTEVDFGLIQEIDGIVDLGGGNFIGSLNATTFNSTAIKLTWDQASTEHPTDPLTGVIIQRANVTIPTPFVTITTVDELDIMFTDTGLEKNTTYSYRVKGQSAVSTGSFGENSTAQTSTGQLNQTEIDTITTSDEQNFNITNAEIDVSSVVDQTVLISPPFPITTLVGSTVGDTCELSWSAPFNGGSPITKYQIFRSVDGSAYSLLLNKTITNHIDTFLVTNVLYEYNVTSINAFGDSESSNIVDCMPIVSAVPTAPTVLQGVEEPNGDVTLTWLEPSAGDPTGYQIQRKIENGGFLILVNDTATPSLTFLDTATDPSVEYTWRLAGWNSLGLGAFSNEVTLRMSSPPDAPILSGAQNGNQIEISWTTPTSANPITGYKIDKRINLGAFFTLIANTTTPSVLNFTDTNVTKPDTFGYRVRALSSAGEGTVSNIVDIVFGSHLIVHVREQDGSGFKGGGIIRGFNSTFSDLIGLDVNSDSTFNNLAVGNFNFTFFDDDTYILNKTFNFPAPAGNLTSEFTINALVFDVDCPANGAGTDIRIKVNYTDAKDITAFPSVPVCDSTDQVSWSTQWQGSAVNDTSTMIADFISTVFKTNAEQFLASADIIPTVYNAGENQIESSTYVVNMTDVTINFNLFLGRAPSGGGSPNPSPSNPAQPTPSIPDPDVVFEQRLTGLSLLSRTHQFAQAGDVIEGSVTVNWEGEINLDVRAIDTSKTDLDIRFDLPPFPLDQRIEGIGEFAMSTADIRYTIVLPADECNPEIGLTQNCFDPTLHTIPLEFEFQREDQVYEASTEVFVDGRPIPLDIVQLQIILLFLVLIASAVFGRFIRNRARGSTRRTKTKKKKFKRKFDSS
jgi:hypothetical protein